MDVEADISWEDLQKKAADRDQWRVEVKQIRCTVKPEANSGLSPEIQSRQRE